MSEVALMRRTSLESVLSHVGCCELKAATNSCRFSHVTLVTLIINCGS